MLIFNLHTNLNVMRKFILFGLLAYASTALAQEKTSLSVADLIESKRFAFVVHEVEKKPGFNGKSGYAPYVFSDNPNPSVMTVRQSYNVTSLPVQNNVQRQYYRLAQTDGSYFKAHNLYGNKTAASVEELREQIYLTQNDDQLIISECKDPRSILDLKGDKFYDLSSKNYKFKSSKKSNGSLTLKYTLERNNQKETFYIDVDAEGKAVLIADPTAEFTTYIHGRIEQIPK